MPSSGTIATATIAPIAGDGMCSSSAVPKISSSSVPTAVTSDGSWVRDPAWSIAAVREVEEPTVNPPVDAGGDVGGAEGEQVAVRARCGSRASRRSCARPADPRAIVTMVSAIAEGMSASHLQSSTGQVRVGGPASTGPSTATPVPLEAAEHDDEWRRRARRAPTAPLARAACPPTSTITAPTEISTDQPLRCGAR